MNKYSEKQREQSKSARQKALLGLIRGQAIATQGELVKQLQSAGIPCTQVSISRDIRELGLIKQGGRYVAPDGGGGDLKEEIADLRANIAAFIRDISVVGDNLIVVKTMPGTAHSVGLLLDHVSWPNLAGTVAGDDTVFIAVHGGHQGCAAAAAKLRDMTKKG